MKIRAYSVLEIKSVDDEQRIIEGIASTPETDRMGDIVEPDGAQYTLPIPLLWQHDSEQPIGQVIAAKVTAAGIQIRAQIAKNVLPQIDNAWALIKSGLVRGLSIGFCPIEQADITGTWGIRFTKWDWYELSCVTIPANSAANIQTVKSFDQPRAASGTPRPVVKLLPGASGSSRVRATRPSAPMKKSYADQIATWEATRKTKTDRMDEILAKSADAGTTLDAAEKEEHDTLEGETKDIDDTIRRLKSAEEREKAAAKPVDGSSAPAGSQSRSHIVVAKKELPKGVGFAQMAMCVAMARGVQSDALAFAKQYYPADSLIEKAILGMRAKAAVGAGAVVTSHWADDLVPYNVLSADFIEYLRAGNIVDKFGAANPGGGADYPALRKVPFNIRVSGFSAGLTGNWVGEGKPAPMSKATSFNTTLTWAKVEALTALTKEEIRFSNPSAEAKVRDDIARAINTRIDIDFVDPAKAAVANVSPASITDSIVATAPTAATRGRADHGPRVFDQAVRAEQPEPERHRPDHVGADGAADFDDDDLARDAVLPEHHHAGRLPARLPGARVREPDERRIAEHADDRRRQGVRDLPGR
jgi:HK97 family phage prohead protease/HK97 family phage major capsid protein